VWNNMIRKAVDESQNSPSSSLFDPLFAFLSDKARH
jgi:hypothetical protein